MKKIIALSLFAATPLAFAGTALTALSTSLSNTDCGVIATGNTAVIKLSKDVMGAYDCTTIAAGVATAHPQGKKKIFRTNSGGGAITESTTTAAPSQTDVNGIATTALGEAS